MKNKEVDLQSLHENLNQVKSLENIQKQIKDTQNNLAELNKLKLEKDKELSKVEKDISDAKKSVSSNNDLIEKHENEIKKIHFRYTTISNKAENIGIEALPFSVEDENQDIEKLYEKLQKEFSLYSELKSNKDYQHENLKLKLESNIADIDQFISEIEQKLFSMPSLERSVETLLENISNQFIKPIKDFLQRYDEFKSFIKKFNN